MKKFEFQFIVAMAVCCSFSMVSCDKEESMNQFSSYTPIVEVSTMSAWQGQTRSANEADMPVLRFRDQQAFDEVINNLKAMDKETALSYFRYLGFDGAYSLWHTADAELDAIFDMEDSVEICYAIENFKEKYSESFSFNPNDEFDVTPYLNFSDNQMALIGNIAGYVVIGETLVEASSYTPNFESHVFTENIQTATRAAVQPGFKAFNTGSFSISQDKFTCTMTLGRIVNGNSFAVEFVTKKKVLFWKKKVEARCTMTLGMRSSIFSHTNNVICPESATVVILGLPIETVGTQFDANITNFTCSKCPDVVGSVSFTNIQVI